MRIALVTVPLVLTSVACGGSLPPPNDEWSVAQEEIGKAEGAGATGFPQAKKYLESAEDELKTAKSLINQDNKRATTLIELARAEAQLAVSLAKQGQAQIADQKAQDDLAHVKGGL
jgi:hypothetical protein